MSKRKATATVVDAPRKRQALSPAFSEDEELAASQPSLDRPTDSEEEEEVGEVEEDEEEPPSFAQYLGESDMEEEVEEEEVDNLAALRNQLAGVPMGTLLQARRNLGATAQRKSAPAPLPPLTNDEIAPPKKQRPRAGKSGRTEPRYATAMTAEPAAPMPSFLTGANADQPGVRREKRERKEVHGRESKHGPAVMSSKRAVPRARQVVEVPRVERRDPRFDSLSGAFDPSRFNKSYGFLDDNRNDEIARLREKVKAKSAASLTPEEREREKKALTRLESQMERRKREERERAVLREHRQGEREARAQGKKPYHLSRAEEKELLEKARVEELTKRGKGALQKSIKKREMKAAQKEKKHRPAPRRLE